MARLLLTATLTFWLAGQAAAQCWPAYPVYPPIYYPVYPLTPAIWGAPAPAMIPPPPPPVLPRPKAGVQEGTEPPLAPKPTEKPADKPKSGPKDEPKEGPKDTEPKDTPRIPKVKLPLPGDPTDPPKRDPAAERGKTYEQFVVPADPKRSEPQAQVKVGFFNHSDRTVNLVVNGESVELPSSQFISRRLPRTFTWSEKGQKDADVVVPPDADGLEIVFRK